MENNISPEDFNRILDYNFDLGFDNWSGRSNDINDIDANSIYKQLEKIKSKTLNYKSGNKDFQKQLSDSIRYVNELRTKYDDIIMMKNELAEINHTSDLHGNNYNDFKKSNAGQDIANILAGNVGAKLENNILGYDIDGVFMSAYDIRKMMNNTVMDKSSKDVLAGMIEYYKTQANREGAGDANVNEIRSKISSEIVDKGNLHSLIRDNMVETEGGSFEKDTINNLLSLTHEDLGVTQKMINDKSGSIKSSDNISPNEAMAVYTELSRDEEMKKNQVVDYFTSHVVDQYENERQQNPSANYINNLQSQQEVLAQATKYEKGSL